MTQSEIVEELKINKSTVSRYVNRGKQELKINMQNV
jgi:DNA-binding transcriptional regulator LsrR (DeoR family)